MVGSAGSATEAQEHGAAARPARLPLALVDCAALLVYLVLLGTAEVLVVTVNPVLVFILHVGLIGLTATYLVVRRGDVRSDPEARVVPAGIALILAPLIRIISLTLPLGDLEPVTRYVAAGAPIAIAGLVAARVMGLHRKAIGLTWREPRWQALAIGVSIGFGFVEFVILQPSPLGAAPWAVSGIGSAVAIGLFTGFPEELVFRGVMQTALRPVLGRWNWLYVSGLFAVLHLGHGSYADIVFVFGVGLFYGWIVERTRSIIGVSIGHGIANVVLFLVAPIIIDPVMLPAFPDPGNLSTASTFALALAGLAVAQSRRAADGDRDLSHADVSESAIGPIQLRVIADPSASRPDATAGILPAERITTPVTITTTAQGTQLEHREPRGAGVVRFTSRNVAEAIFVPAETALHTESGLRFRTARSVVVPRAPAGGIGLAEVRVVAEATGPDGDVAAGAIEGVPAELVGMQLEVSNAAPTKGGTQRVIRRVGGSDYDTARIAASKRSWWDVRRRIPAEEPGPTAKRHVVRAATRLATTLVQPAAESAVGREADSIEITMHRVATTTVVDLDRVRGVALDLLASSIPDGSDLIRDSVRVRVTRIEVLGESVTYLMEASGRRRRAVAAGMQPGHRAS